MFVILCFMCEDFTLSLKRCKTAGVQFVEYRSGHWCPRQNIYLFAAVVIGVHFYILMFGWIPLPNV
jgi:hypothetical protein